MAKKIGAYNGSFLSLTGVSATSLATVFFYKQIYNTHQRKTSPSTRKRNRLWQIYQCSLEIGLRLTVTNIRALDLPLHYYTISNIDFQALNLKSLP